jgi:diacylglycerol kinase
MDRECLGLYVKNLYKSLNFAIEGIRYVIRHERNARIHLILAVFALALGFFLRVTDAQLAAIFFAVIIVFLAEIINTAFEKTLDILSPNHHPQVKIIKDIMAGAVLVAASGAFIIGLIIYTPYILGLIK